MVTVATANFPSYDSSGASNAMFFAKQVNSFSEITLNGFLGSTGTCARERVVGTTANRTHATSMLMNFVINPPFVSIKLNTLTALCQVLQGVVKGFKIYVIEIFCCFNECWMTFIYIVKKFWLSFINTL